jgi:hypothetical protein
MTFDTIETYDGQGNLLGSQSREVPPEELLERRRQRTGLPLTTEEYEAVRAQMQTLRALRQMTQSEFVGLTVAQRARQEYDCLKAITEILLIQLRDE